MANIAEWQRMVEEIRKQSAEDTSTFIVGLLDKIRTQEKAIQNLKADNKAQANKIAHLKASRIFSVDAD